MRSRRTGHTCSGCRFDLIGHGELVFCFLGRTFTLIFFVAACPPCVPPWDKSRWQRWKQARAKTKLLWKQYGLVWIGTYAVLYFGGLGGIYLVLDTGLVASDVSLSSLGSPSCMGACRTPKRPRRIYGKSMFCQNMHPVLYIMYSDIPSLDVRGTWPLT